MSVDLKKQHTVAKRRWQLVKEALKSNRNHISQSDLSGRKFSGYSLFFKEVSPPIANGNDDFTWRRFSLVGDATLDIRIYSDRVTVQDLTGFNNTGNVCIWPSEDVLAHYLLTSQHLSISKHFTSVCEIGGGMTSLAGLALARLGKFSEVLLTDGNLKSVKNIEAIIDRNRSCLLTKTVQAKCLRWDKMDEDDPKGELKNRFDLIICADCLFFKESHEKLLETILLMLCDAGGLCVIVAPKRGDSLMTFVNLAKSWSQQQGSFTVTLSEDYDQTLSQAAKQLLTKQQADQEVTEYSLDQHYPVLIEITKLKK